MAINNRIMVVMLFVSVFRMIVSFSGVYVAGNRVEIEAVEYFSVMRTVSRITKRAIIFVRAKEDLIVLF